MKKSELRQIIKEEITNALNENQSPILLGYILLYNGLPSRIYKVNELLYRKTYLPEGTDFVIYSKKSLTKSDIIKSWFLYNSKEEIQEKINSLKGDVSVVQQNWNDKIDDMITKSSINNLDFNSFKISPVTINWE